MIFKEPSVTLPGSVLRDFPLGFVDGGEERGQEQDDSEEEDQSGESDTITSTRLHLKEPTLGGLGWGGSAPPGGGGGGGGGGTHVQGVGFRSPPPARSPHSSTCTSTSPASFPPPPSAAGTKSIYQGVRLGTGRDVKNHPVSTQAFAVACSSVPYVERELRGVEGSTGGPLERERVGGGS